MNKIRILWGGGGGVRHPPLAPIVAGRERAIYFYFNFNRIRFFRMTSLSATDALGIAA